MGIPNNPFDFSDIDKQTLLYGAKSDPATLVKVAKRFEEAGLLTDAVQFYNRAEDRDSLSRLRKQAVENGDFFTAKQTSSYLGQALDKDELSQIGRLALEKGWHTFAVEAFETAGLENEAAQAKEQWEKLTTPESAASATDHQSADTAESPSAAPAEI